jgi:hypothetical protein
MTFLLNFAHHNPFGAALITIGVFIFILALVSDERERKRWP